MGNRILVSNWTNIDDVIWLSLGWGTLCSKLKYSYWAEELHILLNNCIMWMEPLLTYSSYLLADILVGSLPQFVMMSFARSEISNFDFKSVISLNFIFILHAFLSGHIFMFTVTWLVDFAYALDTFHSW